MGRSTTAHLGRIWSELLVPNYEAQESDRGSVKLAFLRKATQIAGETHPTISQSLQAAATREETVGSRLKDLSLLVSSTRQLGCSAPSLLFPHSPTTDSGPDPAHEHNQSQELLH